VEAVEQGGGVIVVLAKSDIYMYMYIYNTLEQGGGVIVVLAKNDIYMYMYIYIIH
jgi:hypothetical protein